jgi:hypothetical protein
VECYDDPEFQTGKESETTTSGSSTSGSSSSSSSTTGPKLSDFVTVNWPNLMRFSDVLQHQFGKKVPLQFYNMELCVPLLKYGEGYEEAIDGGARGGQLSAKTRDEERDKQRDKKTKSMKKTNYSWWFRGRLDSQFHIFPQFKFLKDPNALYSEWHQHRGYAGVIPDHVALGKPHTMEKYLRFFSKGVLNQGFLQIVEDYGQGWRRSGRII